MFPSGTRSNFISLSNVSLSNPIHLSNSQKLPSLIWKRGCRLCSDRSPNRVQKYLLNVIEERRDEERRGEARRGEVRRGEARQGEKRRGKARRGRRISESQLLHAPKLLQSVLDTWCRHPQYSTYYVHSRTHHVSY
ncbi:hypothetical protein ACLB2K_053110 [Fragaria x ananassa]